MSTAGELRRRVSCVSAYDHVLLFPDGWVGALSGSGLNLAGPSTGPLPALGGLSAATPVSRLRRVLRALPGDLEVSFQTSSGQILMKARGWPKIGFELSRVKGELSQFEGGSPEARYEIARSSWDAVRPVVGGLDPTFQISASGIGGTDGHRAHYVGPDVYAFTPTIGVRSDPLRFMPKSDTVVIEDYGKYNRVAVPGFVSFGFPSPQRSTFACAFSGDRPTECSLPLSKELFGILAVHLAASARIRPTLKILVKVGLEFSSTSEYGLPDSESDPVAVTRKGAECLTGMNVRYLLDTLKAMKTYGAKTVVMAFRDTITPTLFASPEIPQMRAVVAAIRI